VGLEVRASLQKKGGYKKRIARSIMDAAARIKKREDQL
jgi:hypothetical protein